MIRLAKSFGNELDGADCKGLPSKVEDLISGKKNPLMQ